MKKSTIKLLIVAVALTWASAIPAAADSAVKPDPRNTDKVRMLRSTDGAMTIHGDTQFPLADRVANQFAPQFGIRNPTAELRVEKSRVDNAHTHIRYQQMHQGLPVIGGKLVANIDSQQRLTSMSGEVATVRVADTTPAISAEQATQIAIGAMAKWYGYHHEQMISSTPVLSIYDPTIIVTAPRASQSLAWQLNVTPTMLAPVNEYIVIDAKTGGILFHFNKVHDALNRRTYTANGQLVLPGSIVCQDPTPCATTDTDALNAHNFAEDTYDFYFSTHGRDSIDGSGIAIVSTVHFPDPNNPTQPMQNAFWLGADPYLGSSNQMVYGNSFAVDDVVGHELTHGVTEDESGLFYYSESGAINESFSDLWGELIDLSNGVDDPADRWLLGEDLPIGEIRDMADPTTFGDPDRMTSPNFYVGAFDTGGVHINSGVNNKAVYLLVDGDTFNGVTVNSIGPIKTAKIYYRAQTAYLTSGSDYLDLYNALIQSCTDLIGSDGIVAGDCTQVQNALNAVEMNQTPSAGYAPQATEICPTGINIYDLFTDTFEDNNTNPWIASNLTGSSNPWSTSNVNLASNSGSYSLISNGSGGIFNPTNDNDSVLRIPTAIRVPASETMYIYFDHAFYFETDVTTYYDGGLIEYSTDNGTTWNDAEALIESGRDYIGALAQFNPQTGRQAFTGYSNGYVSTRLDLTPLTGQFVLFRFRNAADESVPSAPWFIDNFRMYVCADNAPPSPNAGPDQVVNVAKTVQLTGTATDPDNDIISTQWTQVSGTPVALNGAATLTPNFAVTKLNDDLIFRLTITDANGHVESDDVSIIAGNTLSGNGCSSCCFANSDKRYDPIWLMLLLSLSALHVRNRYQFRRN